jgi:hypothetical protein
MPATPSPSAAYSECRHRCRRRRDGDRSDDAAVDYSVKSTTVASAAFFSTDSMPFFALAFDS